ncbi:MAG: DUF1580 domain-containing protein [Phycisphaerales bacterium]|nr:DUF1580 domain-containing protein [Phycisphaerales bacterium]
MIESAGGINPLEDQLLSVREAAAKFGEIEDGPAPSYSTMMRRFHPDDPAKPRLESIIIGGRRFTTLEAILAWIAAVNGWDNGNGGATGTPVSTPKPPNGFTPLQRIRSIRRAHDQAQRKLGVQLTLEPLPLDQIV